MKTIWICLLTGAMLCTLSACNNEDDVMEIFNDKTWKLARLTNEGGKEQFYSGLWTNTTDEENSRSALQQEGNFTLSFNLAGMNDAQGTIEAHGIRANINNASVIVNGEDQTMSISGRISGTETDPLAKAFLNGLLNVFKYEGDNRSITLYFKDGTTTKVMGFTVQ